MDKTTRNEDPGLTYHLEDFYNPHNVHKFQLGLGNVDNVKQYSELNPPPNYIESVCSKKPDATGNIKLVKGDVGLGKVDNLKQYSEVNQPPYPVTSVNGMTGNVLIENNSAELCNIQQRILNLEENYKTISNSLQGLNSEINVLSNKIQKDVTDVKTLIPKFESKLIDIKLKGDFGYIKQFGRYTIIGDVCFVQFNFVFNGEKPLDIIDLELTNLPKPPKHNGWDNAVYFNYVYLSGMASNIPSVQAGIVRQYDDRIIIYGNDGKYGGFAKANTSWIKEGSVIAGSLWYNI